MKVDQASFTMSNELCDQSLLNQLVIPGFEVYFEPEDDEDEHEHSDKTDATDYEGNGEQNHVNDQEERLRMPCFSHTLQLTIADGLK